MSMSGNMTATGGPVLQDARVRQYVHHGGCAALDTVHVKAAYYLLCVPAKGRCQIRVPGKLVQVLIVWSEVPYVLSRA